MPKTVYAPSMSPLCALYAPSMRPLCALYAPSVRDYVHKLKETIHGSRVINEETNSHLLG